MKRASLKAAARRDLQASYEHGYREWGRAAADQYAAMITAVVAYITEYPLTKPAVEGRDPLRRCNVGSHVIFYRPTREGIAVIRVMHDAMDARRHLG